MSHFTEQQLQEIAAAFGLKRADTLPVRDGVVTKSTMVWWRGEKNCECVLAAKDWENIKSHPHAYQLAEPNRRVQYFD